MKTLLLTVALALVCGLLPHKIKAQDSPELSGEWFTVALASNVTSKIEEGGSLHVFVNNVQQNGNVLYADFFKRENEKCVPFSVTAFIKEDGHMYVEYDGHNDFTVQSLGSEHVIYILFNIKNGEVTVWGELFGRTPDLPDETKQEFEEICESFGIRKDQIRDLSQDDRCGKLR